MLPGDSETAAKQKAMRFNDPRVRQFWDPNQRSGKAIAESLGYKGRVAWDIYLFYIPGGGWIQHPPDPAGWMHQISEGWVDDDHFFTGDDLMQKLYNTAQGLLAKKVTKVN
jgi:hypothetical protein